MLDIPSIPSTFWDKADHQNPHDDDDANDNDKLKVTTAMTTTTTRTKFITVSIYGQNRSMHMPRNISTNDVTTAAIMVWYCSVIR